jgi:hypothetical protein
MNVRYEVSTVTTYKVTRMESDGASGSILTIGEYATRELAERAAALLLAGEPVDFPKSEQK